MHLRIVSWNINGLRSLPQAPAEFSALLDAFAADIIAVQETKLGFGTAGSARTQLILDDYDSFAARARVKQGYSGVATYTRARTARPDHVSTRLFDAVPGVSRELDAEGRGVVSFHGGALAVVNVYCPNGGSTPARRAYKAAFHDALSRALWVLRARGFLVVLVGDLNAVACPRDAAWVDTPPDPLPHSWQWLASLTRPVEDGGHGMVDAFRVCNPGATDAYTCWNTKISARDANLGSRIDYILVDAALAPFVASARILSDVMGSDHAPVSVDLLLEGPIAPLPRSPPPAASIYLDELSGTQTILDAFVVPSSSSTFSPTAPTLPAPPLRSPPRSPPRPKRPPKPPTLLAFFAREPRAERDRAGAAARRKPSCPRDNTASTIEAWSTLLGPGASRGSLAPLCSHREPTKKLAVTKPGPNQGREFFICARPVGLPSSNPLLVRCDFFQWESDTRSAHTARRQHGSGRPAQPRSTKAKRKPGPLRSPRPPKRR